MNMKNLQLSGILIAIGILAYIITQSILAPIGAFLLLFYFIIIDIIEKEKAIKLITIISIIIGAITYSIKGSLPIAVCVSLMIMHFGTRTIIEKVKAIRNEIIFIFLFMVIVISILIGVIREKISVISSSSDDYISALAILIGTILYLGYSLFHIIKKYKSNRYI